MTNEKVKESLIEYGISGFDFSGDFVTSDFLPILNWPNAGKIYEEMSKNDATIGAIIYMSKQLVRKAKWDVKVDSTDAKDLEAADFLKSCMDDMEQSWNEFIGDVLTMMVYGWSYHEVVYKIRMGNVKDKRRHSKYSDGRIGWRKISGRAQRTCYGWEIDQETGDILALKQMAAPDYKLRYIPIDKAIHFKTENDYGNPYGKSLLRNAYRSWFFKKRIEEIEGIGIERDLAGLPVLTPPEDVNIWDADDANMVRLKNASEALVKNIRRDQSEGVVVPHGWELQLLSTGSRRQFDTNMILNRYDQRIAITLLADIVMLGADKVGSFALADVKKSLLSATLETLLASIADNINRQEVPRILALNGFNPTVMPELYSDEVETPDLEQISKLLSAMSSAGMKVNDPAVEEFLRKIASMPATPEELLELKKELYKNSIVEPPTPPPTIPKETPTDPTNTELEKSSIDETYVLRKIFKGTCGICMQSLGEDHGECDEYENCMFIRRLKDQGGD